jgi:hypothetical protein
MPRPDALADAPVKIFAPLWQREIPAAGTTKEMILVAPDAFSLHNGSFYSNSKTTGDWETFIAGTGRCGSG